MPELSDFHESAKTVLSLVEADLALGRQASAAEAIRMALVEASRCGMRRALVSEGLIYTDDDLLHISSAEDN